MASTGTAIPWNDCINWQNSNQSCAVGLEWLHFKHSGMPRIWSVAER